jgi:nucleoside-diphosphate-sugar epimerase
MATTPPAPLTGTRILVTGVTGMVAGPMASRLVDAGNTVFGAARFADPAQRAEHEAKGISTIRVDLERGELDEVPDDLDYVLHFAVAKTNDFARDLSVNADGAANLMEKVQGVDAFFHCSSGGVYQGHEHDHLKEDAALGDSHRAAGMESYSISKIAAETMVQYTAKRLGIPTVIARLSVPYGDTFGWPFFHVMMLEHGMAIPVHTDAPSQYNPLHLDDIVASLPLLLASASTPANVVNWGGDEVVSIEEWCALIGELIDKPVNFEHTDASIPPLILDVGKLNDLGFHSSVGWRDGITRLVQTSRPDLVAS